MQTIRLTSLSMLLLLLAACVTINIYFPAAAADKAADRIVEDILGTEQQEQPNEDDDKGASLIDLRFENFALNPLDWLIPAAHAAEPDFTADTPQIRQLQAEMKHRHPDLAPYYATGAIGFTAGGLVELRDAGAVPLRERSVLNNLLTAENRDRNALYQAIANANGHPEWVDQVRGVFAGKWIEKAAAGWWYQTSQGAWKQK